ncbi:gluconokinase [Pediococcus claussenii]|uniref:Carbohydrate kinase, FGGY family n=1 Tax=Pediococcus claussenii (strain ATCC BAA-344 / DSM 14800 / JCM 18046 / KCTC 3811 / LMG 21948 / P06) TaxID=701521 RepID=G8PC38_PEDCP|nr:FGGY family carbohydrate kinase [Pediococcus claussenii]AEV94857.1 carbohydrate kinase, FGGY family [Pediococcus claussenii ATCC BAA-344]ANZ70053.1 gluconate kinase [Pediococcus claussenii]ANZ71868.1 gluconate kinase [Pediococcus claussenii]KRN21035.1 hypothetical protein IV79_GL000261 [Pediococcus claussenii]
MKYIIGTDLGTTSTKSILYSTDGKVVAYSNVEYPLYHDKPDMAEENPEEIWNAVVKTIKSVGEEVDKDQIIGISFSSAMHSLLLLDENNIPLTRVITWADNRAVKYATKLKNSELGQKIYEATGTPIHPMSPLSKLIWLSEENADLLVKSRWIIGIKEYIIYRLTGEMKMEYSIANATGYFNLHTFDWDDQALSLTKATRDQLPELVDTDYTIDHLTSEAAKKINLNQNAAVTMGASDGALSNLGVGADRTGVAAITIGTSGAVRVMSNKPYLDPEGRLFCYYVAKDHWIIGGPVNNGGQVFRWVRDYIYDNESNEEIQNKRDPYDRITKDAANVPIGSHGIIFHPYFSGERAPLWNTDARGSMIGLTTSHTRADIARAVLEGIVLNLNQVLKLTESATKVNEIRATGGFARSTLWRQILTDVIGIPITIPESFESSCLAAAVLGLKAHGEINSIDKVHDMIGNTKEYAPISENHKQYVQVNKIYELVGKQLEPIYHDLAHYQRNLSQEMD